MMIEIIADAVETVSCGLIIDHWGLKSWPIGWALLQGLIYTGVKLPIKDPLGKKQPPTLLNHFPIAVVHF